MEWPWISSKVSALSAAATLPVGTDRKRLCKGLGVADVIARSLLQWYRRAGRDLPWRRSRDPYAVWVSEVMLQQTQVERVKEYFSRFMDRFPTVHDLAAAAEADVLKAWEGLGYYRRARQLHATAGIVVSEHGGIFPREVVRLRDLPGIGRYTAAAIASIAFDRPEPIVEANSRRVIARLIGHALPLDGPGGDEPIWEAAGRLVPRRSAGRFNQAVMDLGAMICTVDRPLCGHCPLAVSCAAHQTSRTAEIPVKTRRATVRQLRETAHVILARGGLLVEQRQPGDWWAGLWDFPRTIPSGVVPDGSGRRLGAILYSVTNHRISCRVMLWTARSRGRLPHRYRWLHISALDDVVMSAPGRRIVRLARPVAGAAGASDPEPRGRKRPRPPERS
jgi:A/G-specific adenine glycosylase